MRKAALALLILIPCAILASPAWMIMRAFNEYAARRREREAKFESAKWDAEIAKVREELRRPR